MPDCRTCGAHLGPRDSTCPACGARTSGATESFEPVVAVGEGGAGAHEVIEGPVLVVRKGPQSGERFYLDRPRLTVGRDPESDIFLNDMTVSRSHAFLEIADGRVTVRDASSLNGTWVNGICVDAAELHDGDVVQVGTFQMVFIEGAGLLS